MSDLFFTKMMWFFVAASLLVTSIGAANFFVSLSEDDGTSTAVFYASWIESCALDPTEEFVKEVPPPQRGNSVVFFRNTVVVRSHGGSVSRGFSVTLHIWDPAELNATSLNGSTCLSSGTIETMDGLHRSLSFSPSDSVFFEKKNVVVDGVSSPMLFLYKLPKE